MARHRPAPAFALVAALAASAIVVAVPGSGRAQAPADRLAGDTRYGTAVAISQAAFPDGATVAYLARAVEPLVDALAGGALADGPVLLVPGCGDLPDEVAAEVDRLAPTRVVALGGPAAICDGLVLAAASVVGAPAYRLAGDTRFGTAVKVSRATFPQGADTVYVARATAPLVDALAGGALTDGPVLLVPGSGEVPPAVLAEVERLAPTSVMALGGTDAVADEVLQAAAARGREPGPGEPTPTPSDTPTDGPTGAPTEAPAEVAITAVVADPGGPETFDDGEFLVVQNRDDEPVQMAGWYVVDDDGIRIPFCTLGLWPGARARLYTGAGFDGVDHCHANVGQVLDDGGETLTLFRPDGSVAAVFTYG
jgi:hypothetical protein